MAKSSSEILNELFSSFNTCFDEAEALAEANSPSGEKSKKRKKHTKKKRDKEKDHDREHDHDNDHDLDLRERKKKSKESTVKLKEKSSKLAKLSTKPSSRSRSRRLESTVSVASPPRRNLHGVDQITSGIVWRDPKLNSDRSRSHNRNYSAERTYYFDESRKHDESNSNYRRDRDRSRSPNRYNYISNSNSNGYDSRRRNSPSSTSTRDSRRNETSGSRSPRTRTSYRRERDRDRHPDDIIDKAKLLEIARHNAAKLMKNGVLPSDIFSRDQMIAIRAGGKSVGELTNYCQRLAKQEALGIEDVSSGDSGDERRGRDFIHHPFVVKDRPMPGITMNIRNAIPLPVRSAHELAIENAKLKVQFPVSSGTQHRLELEWKPVEKDDEKEAAAATDGTSKSLVSLEGLPVGTVAPMPQIPVESIPLPPSDEPLAIMPPPQTAKPTSGIKHDPPPQQNLDIGAIISVRLRAMRKLQQDPDDVIAKEQLEEATQEMKTWAETKALEPKFLSPQEISGGPQAWAKKDQLKNAAAVSGGMGMHLLQRMGWKPGEGLGKNKEGGTEPLALDVKTDKKGLTATTELKTKEKQLGLQMIYDLSGKHPVSALMELCVKRKWGPPNFDLCFEHGPPHKKQFVYKVVVNGVEYQPCVATNNKKMAKTNAAAFCLQSLGLLPTADAPPSTETLRTVPEIPPLMGPPLLPTQGSSSGANVTSMQKLIPPLPQAASHTLQTVLPVLPQPCPPPPLPPLFPKY